MGGGVRRTERLGHLARPATSEDADAHGRRAASTGLLEEQVVPLYYTRDAARHPAGLGGADEARASGSAGARFTARRMVQEYVHEVLRARDPGRRRPATTRPPDDAEPATGRAASPAPLPTPGGEPVSVVHLTAEYFPYARTGGLAEAVSGLASVPARARRSTCRRPDAPVPHGARRRPRPRAGRPAVPGTPSAPGSRRPGSSGSRETGRPGPRCSSSSIATSSTAPASTASSGADYPDNAPPLRLLRARGADARCRGSRPGRSSCTPTTGTPRSRRSTCARRSRHEPCARAASDGAVGAQRGLPGPLPARGHARARAARRSCTTGASSSGTASSTSSRAAWPSPTAPSTVSPTHARGAVHAGRRIRAARGVHGPGRPAGRHPQRDRPARRGTRRPTRRSPPATRADDLAGKRRCKAALQRSFGLPRAAAHAAVRHDRPPGDQQKGLDLILREPPSSSRRTPSSSSSAPASTATSEALAGPGARPLRTGSASSSPSPTGWSTGSWPAPTSS